MIQRDIHLNRLVQSKHNGFIKIVTGIRRCGKSTLLFKLFVDHLLQSGVLEDHIVRIDMEDRRNKELRDADALLQYIDSRIVDGNMYYILIDEVQQVEHFSDVLNSYLKMPNTDIYVTGSNSRFLSSDVATEFRGRGLEIHISPLNFKEFFSVYEGDKYDALQHYLTYGGMPQLMHVGSESMKMKMLKDLFVTTYLKDIRERYSIQHEDAFEELLNILASGIGTLTNPTKLEHTFASRKHLNLSRATIGKYIQYMEEAFLIRKVNRFDIKGKRYIDTPFKCYYCDVGLRNARLNFRQQEVTHLMENLIYNELIIRGFAVDVGHVEQMLTESDGTRKRHSLEVDFVCSLGSKRVYVQSAYSMASDTKREQELRSLNAIDDNFRKVVITADPITSHQNNDGIFFINLFDFLLSDNPFE